MTVADICWYTLAYWERCAGATGIGPFSRFVCVACNDGTRQKVNRVGVTPIIPAPTDAERAGLQGDLAAFAEADAEVAEGLRARANACFPHGNGGSRLRDTVEKGDQTVVDVSKAPAPKTISTPCI